MRIPHLTVKQADIETMASGLQTITLPDGRKVDYLVSGPADGFPFLYLHGTPGSAVPHGPALLGPCQERNLKLITISRAGYGGTSRWKGRRVVDVVPDVQALLGHLGIEECLVGGMSGGGAFITLATKRGIWFGGGSCEL